MSLALEVRAIGVLAHSGGPLALPLLGGQWVLHKPEANATLKKVIAKKRGGRPATGKDPLITARFPRDLIARLDRYASEQNLSRSQALRAIVIEALDKHRS